MTMATDPNTTRDVLSDEQRARAQALIIARDMLTRTVGFAQSGTNVGEYQYVEALQELAEYVLTGVRTATVEGVDPLAGGILILPRAGELVDVQPGNGSMPAIVRAKEGEAQFEWRTPEFDPTPESMTEHVQLGATEEMLQRHAEKQGCSLSDAFEYFDEQGYNMSAVKHLEFS
jgi:hypothetical protein